MSAWLVAKSISSSFIPSNSLRTERCIRLASRALLAAASASSAPAYSTSARSARMSCRCGTAMPMSPSTSGSSPVLSPPMVLAVGEVVSRTLRPCSMVEKRVVTSSFDAPAGAAGDGRVSTASSDVSAASQAWRNGTRCDRPKSCVWTASLSTTYVNRHGECVQGVGAALPALAPPVAFGAGCTSSVAEMRLPSDAMATDVTREACGCPAPLATSCRACACWRGSWREMSHDLMNPQDVPTAT
mmetsp:Transcript_2927/g.8948  ORF Transcript_2927/g.8948 Transcript_2927/m.8948 type:complete len:243 (+) Transcript_2927:2505-3233(+)